MGPYAFHMRGSYIKTRLYRRQERYGGHGQCHGGATILSGMGNAEAFIFMIMGHFTNETLNQGLVKNVRTEHVGGRAR
jgi:hypothetical protein